MNDTKFRTISVNDENEVWYFPQYDDAWNRWAFFMFGHPCHPRYRYGDALRFYNSSDSEKFLSIIENRFLCRKSQEVIDANLVIDQIRKYHENPLEKKIGLGEYLNLLRQNKFVDPNDPNKPSDLVDAHNNGILLKTNIHYEIYQESPRLKILKIIFTDNVKYFPLVDEYFICIDFLRLPHSYANQLFTETLEQSKEILHLIGDNLIKKELHWNLFHKMFVNKTLPYTVL